jgi:NTP pyrophosphatase (non-canonical NTP hydrolase)
LDRERELEKRNSALLIEKDAMEANCIALQKKFDGVKTIGVWVYEVHKNAVQHGWYDGKGAKNFGELLMLVVTEVAEVMEEYRNGRLMKETYVNKNGKMCGIPSELADIVIRVMDICGYYNIDLEQAIAEKHEYNKSRPYKHGGKKC